jgi:hypothetical protein
LKIKTSLEDLAQMAWDIYTKRQVQGIMHYTELPLNVDQLRQIDEMVGIRLNGYSRIADLSALIHVFKQHGDEKREALRGQKAVTLDVVMNLQELLSYAELVDNWLENGKLKLKWVIQFDSQMILVEEVRTGRNELALNSIRIMHRRS